MKNKAQGISISVIIIAAIALLVLVVLAAIFLGRMGIWGPQVSECENKGGKCIPAGIGCGGSGYEDWPTENKLWTCKSEEPLVCCLKVET